MALDLSSSDFCLNGLPIIPYPFNPESYSLTELVVCDDYVDPSYFQLPKDLEKPSANSSIPPPPAPRPKQGADVRHIPNSHFDGFDVVRSRVAIKGNCEGNSNDEVTARRRREQNRASQRAYRARRDRHVEDLEQRNQFLQRHASALLEENEQLKKQLSQLISAGNGFVSDLTISAGVSPPSSTIASSSASAALSSEETRDSIQDYSLYKYGHISVDDVY